METFATASLIAESVKEGNGINSGRVIGQIEPLVDFLIENPNIPNERSLLGKKRVALVIPYHPLYETGGLEIGTRKLAEGLKKLGHNVEIISRGLYADRDLSGKIVSPEGIDIQGVGSGIEEIVPYILGRQRDFDIVQWMEIFPPVPEKASVYNDKAEQQYLTSVVLRVLGVHTFLYVATSGNVTNRGVNNPRWEMYSIQRLNRYLQAGMEGYDMINSEISEEYKNAGIKINFEDHEVIPLGVDTDRFKPVQGEEKLELRRQLGLPANKVIFICPGRFVSRKKQNLLFSVWERMPEGVKNSASLLFVGGKAGQGQPDSIYEPLTEKIKKYLARGRSDVINVDLVSHDEMTKYIQASDALIFPSEREGLGMVVLETMACGKPVFASNISGVRDIIQGPDVGTLFEPNNPDQIEKSLNSFLNSPDKYIRKSLKARNYVVNNWDWKSICKKLNKFYERF